jgi:hypothetical protein
MDRRTEFGIRKELQGCEEARRIAMEFGCPAPFIDRPGPGQESVDIDPDECRGE